ncbi:MAG: DoxX family protein [Neisseria sp.]|uniref:DoxX family protein n=1 Tax=Neisseria sp. TaxID=192066 RepID=UPI0026DB82DC|nr:DoxX family protein [Neisseria sp.]MDO4640390.1 DoxX family protein [Neisseria sp.]
MNSNKWADCQAIVLSILRIATAYMFMLHGSSKLLGMPHSPMFDGLQIFSLYGFAGILELVGGILLLLGLFTRPVAFILSGQMAVAYFIGHVASGGNFAVPFLNKGESAVLFCFVFLYLSVAGGGKWALDCKRSK